MKKLIACHNWIQYHMRWNKSNDGLNSSVSLELTFEPQYMDTWKRRQLSARSEQAHGFLADRFQKVNSLPVTMTGHYWLQPVIQWSASLLLHNYCFFNLWSLSHLQARDPSIEKIEMWPARVALSDAVKHSVWIADHYNFLETQLMGSAWQTILVCSSFLFLNS